MSNEHPLVSSGFGHRHGMTRIDTQAADVFFHVVFLDRDCYLVLLHRGCVTWKSYIGIFLWVLNYEWVQMSRLAAAPGRVADRDGSIETQGGLVGGVFALGTLVFCGSIILGFKGCSLDAPYR